MAEVELYLLRHAHAGDPAEWTADDAARPLSSKGRRQAQALGRFLALRGFSPDAIVSSPKLRALETGRIVADALGIGVATDDRLAGPLDLPVLTDVLLAAGGQQIVVVGHDPDFSDLAGELAGGVELPMKKGALARFDASLPLIGAGGTLRWLLPPELVAEHAD
ncbi:MAG TPA: histidine phosphatase family protein [Candidatus Limnocylindria bacterium]|nr:histidine phosphatase family protein [Candidatus Limnocylindria bacterium]